MKTFSMWLEARNQNAGAPAPVKEPKVIPGTPKVKPGHNPGRSPHAPIRKPGEGEKTVPSPAPQAGRTR